MKKRTKILIGIITTLLIATSIIVMISLDISPSKPPYTVFNYGKQGAGLLYDTLSIMEYPIQTSYQKVTGNTSIHDVYIFIEPNSLYFTPKDEDALLEWVKRGGQLVYFAGTDSLHNGLAAKLEQEYPAYVSNGFALVEVGLGEVLIGSAETITNEWLLYDRSSGYVLESQLEHWWYDNVYVNENCHGFSSEPGLWQSLPLGFKMLVLQLALVTALAVFHMGKRFGRPRPFYEEIEREENEYLIALSNIYEKSGKGYALYDMYFNHFIKKCVGYFHIETNNRSQQEIWEKCHMAWNENNLPHGDYFTELCAITPEELNTKRKNGCRRFNNCFKKINELNNSLKHF